MSIQSWKAQHYTKKAKKATRSIKAATKHALKKWKGLTTTTLTEHGLYHEDMNLIVERETGDSFVVSADQCALCCYDNKAGNGDCDVCPLFKVDGQACWHGGSPYHIWQESGNAKPMIKALKKTLKAIKAGDVK